MPTQGHRSTVRKRIATAGLLSPSGSFHSLVGVCVRAIVDIDALLMEDDGTPPLSTLSFGRMCGALSAYVRCEQ